MNFSNTLALRLNFPCVTIMVETHADTKLKCEIDDAMEHGGVPIATQQFVLEAK